MAKLSSRIVARALAFSSMILLTNLPAGSSAADPADSPAYPTDAAQSDAPPPTPSDVRKPSADNVEPPASAKPSSPAPLARPPPATRGADRIGSNGADRERDVSGRRVDEIGLASGAVGALFDLGARRRAQAAETYVEGEAIVEVASSAPPAELGALESRYRLRGVDLLVSGLTSTTWILVETPGRTTAAAVRELQADPEVLSAQPNQLFVLQDATRPSAAARDYAESKLQLPEAHQLATGDGVLVAIIDSAVDSGHPELRGAIAKTYDAIGGPVSPHAHGTATAALIVGHGRLPGAAPGARILFARAFEAEGDGGARGASFRVMKALDWAAANGARVINMSFAGPFDPAIHSHLDGAYRQGVVLIAAAGNGGPRSPPLYPAADPDVIAVTATDNADRIWAGANRGAYIGLAAPGVDVLVAAPNGAYELSTGTSVSAAEVSGVAALLLQRRPSLTPVGIRSLLLSTATPLPPLDASGPSAPRLADAYRAVAAVAPVSR
jgi:subtilisin family serine protease